MHQHNATSLAELNYKVTAINTKTSSATTLLLERRQVAKDHHVLRSQWKKKIGWHMKASTHMLWLPVSVWAN